MQSIKSQPDLTYHSYRNLPPVAGLCSLQEGTRTGLSVEQCVNRLKRYHYALKRLHGILIARITAEPIYELKLAFSLHATIAPSMWPACDSECAKCVSRPWVWRPCPTLPCRCSLTRSRMLPPQNF